MPIKREPILSDQEIAELSEDLEDVSETPKNGQVIGGSTESLKDAFSPKQSDLLRQNTPPQFVKSRPGRGGQSFNYVAVGYVVSVLNKAFGHLWDWEIEDQQIGSNQVWVRGRLTINSFSTDQKIIKSAYGGSQIKTDQMGKPIDIADDLKAASSDALKKCASLVGVASDIYYPQGVEE